MHILDDFTQDVVEKLIRELQDLCNRTDKYRFGKKSLKIEDIMTAAKLMLPGNIFKEAHRNAMPAVETYTEERKKLKTAASGRGKLEGKRR